MIEIDMYSRLISFTLNRLIPVVAEVCIITVITLIYTYLLIPIVLLLLGYGPWVDEIEALNHSVATEIHLQISIQLPSTTCASERHINTEKGTLFLLKNVTARTSMSIST